MTPEQFWYGDISLMSAYAIAYHRRINLEAWTYGQYTTMAHDIALYNAFRSQGQPAKQYPEYHDNMEQYSKPKQKKITKDNIEEVFREYQIEQMEYLRSILNRKQ